MTTPGRDIRKLKQRMQAAWSAGDYDTWSKYLEPAARQLLDSIVIAPGASLLDVACGAGQLPVEAARRGAVVTGVDIARPSLEAARKRAAAAGLTIQFDEGDVEQLPYADASFDVVTSLFGAMFAPQPELAASELLRVCRSGGIIAMANWTSRGFLGEMIRLTARFLPPPDIPPAGLWGDPETVAKRLGGGAAKLEMTHRTFTFQYPFPPREVVAFYRRYFGRTQASFNALAGDERAQHALESALIELWRSHNRASDGATTVDSEYLEVIATRA